MKILQISSTFSRYEGDTEAPWMIELVKRLNKDNKIEIFAPSFRGLKTHYINGIKVNRFRYFFKQKEDLSHESGMPSKIKKLSYKFIFLCYMFFGALALRKLIKKNHYDIIEVNWPAPHWFWILFARPKRTKLVLHFHGAGLLLAKKFKIFKWIIRDALKKADATIVNSSFTAKKVKEIYNVKCNIIPYGSAVLQKDVTHPKEEH